MHHIGLAVKNLDISTNFYCDAFDLVKGDFHSTPELNIQNLTADNITLELLQFKNDSIPARATGLFDHIAFVVDNLNNKMAQLKTMGVEFTESPRQTIMGNKIIFFSGPDGERLELMERK